VREFGSAIKVRDVALAIFRCARVVDVPDRRENAILAVNFDYFSVEQSEAYVPGSQSEPHLPRVKTSVLPQYIREPATIKFVGYDSDFARSFSNDFFARIASGGDEIVVDVKIVTRVEARDSLNVRCSVERTRETSSAVAEFEHTLTPFACSLISDVHSLAHTHDEDRRTAMSRLSSNKVGGNR